MIVAIGRNEITKCRNLLLLHGSFALVPSGIKKTNINLLTKLSSFSLFVLCEEPSLKQKYFTAAAEGSKGSMLQVACLQEVFLSTVSSTRWGGGVQCSKWEQIQHVSWISIQQ